NARHKQKMGSKPIPEKRKEFSRQAPSGQRDSCVPAVRSGHFREAVQERTDLVARELDILAALESSRQRNGAVAQAHQTTDRQSDGVEHAAHLPVAPFTENDAIPVVEAAPALVRQLLEMRRPVLQVNAFLQLAHLLRRELP